MTQMDNNIGNIEKVDGESRMHYGTCLNCGAELIGGYCHLCGQEAADKSRTIVGFVKELLAHAEKGTSVPDDTINNLVYRYYKNQAILSI